MLHRLLALAAIGGSAPVGPDTGCTGPLYPLELVAPGAIGAVRAADFDGDGVTDLLVDGGAGQLSLYIGIGDGAFEEPRHTPLGGPIGEVQAGDLTNDGRADVVVNVQGVLRVLVAEGPGAFRQVSPPALEHAFHRTLALDDLDQDGTLDLLVHEQGDSRVALLRGDGTGLFAPHSTLELGVNVYDLFIGHLNGDTHIDFAFVPVVGAGGILLNDGAGALVKVTEFPLLGMASRSVAGDFNGDGNPDIAFPDSYSTIATYWGDGGLGFRPGTTDVRTPISSLLAADLDQDGLDDLIGSQHNPSRAKILRGRTGYGFDVQPSFGLEGPVSFSTAAHLDRNQSLDLVVSWYDQPGPAVLLGSGHGWLAPREIAGVGAETVLVADLDGDRALDVILSGGSHHVITIAHGLGDGTFSEPFELASGLDRPRRSELADFDGDGRADLLVVPEKKNKVAIHFARAPGEFVPSLLVDVPDFEDATSGDLDNDGISDLVAVGGSVNANASLGNGDGTFGDWTQMSIGIWPMNVELADLDGDGDLDLLATTRLYGQLWVLFGNGDGTFEEGYEVDIDIPGATSGGELVTADLNVDGLLDVAVAAENIQILMGVGGGALELTAVYEAGGSRSVTTADVNGDGIPDLLGGMGVVLLGRGDGSFEERAFAGVPGGQWATAGDFDGNGSPDLVLANYERAMLYPNLCGQATAKPADLAPR